MFLSLHYTVPTSENLENRLPEFFKEKITSFVISKAEYGEKKVFSKHSETTSTFKICL